MESDLSWLKFLSNNLKLKLLKTCSLYLKMYFSGRMGEKLKFDEYCGYISHNWCQLSLTSGVMGIKIGVRVCEMLAFSNRFYKEKMTLAP